MRLPLLISANRDSVCAGDDCESHEKQFEVSLQTPSTALVMLAERACNLAGIAGGNATGIVEVGGYNGKAIAVVAQQWLKPRMLVSESETAEHLFVGRDKKIFFKYWCQANPEAVHEALTTGTPLPSRYA